MAKATQSDLPALKKRGRPVGPRTVRVPVLLFADQRDQLEILASVLDGHPSITGLIRDAVAQYLEKKRQNRAFDEALSRRASVLQMLR